MTTASAESSSSDRLVLIDLVRSLSILLVLASHFGLARLFTHTDTRQDFMAAPLWTHFARNGTYGVSLFFLISGFLITNLLVENIGLTVSTITLREFYSRRAARLFPLLGLIIVVGTVLPLFWFAAPSPIVLFSFAQRITPAGLYASLVTSVFNFYVIARALHHNYPGAFWLIFWSLSIEEQFYFFYPLMLRRINNTRRILQILGAIVLLGLASRLTAYLLAPQNFELGFYNSFGAFDQIALGCLLSFILRMNLFSKTLWRYGLCICGFCLVVFIYCQASLSLGPTRIYAPLLLDGGLFLFLLGGLQFNLRASWMIRLACLPGKLSYGMYLWHITVLILCWTILRSFTLWEGFGIYAALSTAVAYLSYYGYERPANQRIRRLFKHPA